MNKKLKIKLFVLALSLGIISSTTTNTFAEENSNKDRIYGNDRIQTSIEISKKGWKEGADSVVIAAAYDFADALSAAPLAKKYNAPIILNGKSELSTSTINEIKRLNPKNIFILGGEGVIPGKVENQLKVLKVENVERIYGENRYETSLKVAEKLGKVEKVFITNGETYADALSVSSIAAEMECPILYTKKDELKCEVRNYINNNDIKSTYFIGGQGVLSNSVVNEVKNSKRIYGDNRYLTNSEVLKNFKDELKFDNVYFVTGNNFADALAVAPLSSKEKSPVILTNKNVGKEIENLINENITGETKLIAIGGEKVVPESILDNFISDFDVIEIALKSINLI
ncbi:cell wall-binding repeat-containing protein [Clostridium ihumii]|uniref:cell wall-binding repeat-containing protein n=1 Tax=Clostridium ihumii TaxID=1470356 RepID=UPI003D3339AB